ncbi:MAG: hypothetical protein WAO61_05335 [Solirubrobacterales bacterium]
MNQPPQNVTLASAYAATSADAAWDIVSDPAQWPNLFPGWLARIAADDDSFHATGTAGERYDLYWHPSDDRRSLDVEIVDEMGSADVLRLRLIDARGGGCFVVVAAGRLAGVSDADWRRTCDALADGVRNVGAAV